MLWLDGEDVRPLSAARAQAAAADTLKFDDPLRFTAHRNEDGEAFFAEACRNGWEGLIAKRADSPYGGGRSRTGSSSSASTARSW